MIDFAFNLQSIRKKRHLTQEGLAELVGLTRAAIGNYEQGSRFPDHDDIIALAQALNCSVGALFEGDIDLSEEEIQIIKDIRFLNDEGFEKLKAYIHDLMEIDKYLN
jgi:transcriptional regulator with XRE-family HTH domain